MQYKENIRRKRGTSHSYWNDFHYQMTEHTIHSIELFSKSKLLTNFCWVLGRSLHIGPLIGWSKRDFQIRRRYNVCEDEIWLQVFSRFLKTTDTDTPEASLYFFFFSPEKLAMLSFFEPRKMLKLLTFDNQCFRHHDILAKSRSGMTTSFTFSRQNDADLRVSTTYSIEKISCS